MKPWGSNRNLHKATLALATPGPKRYVSSLPELKSWQPKVVLVEKPCHNYCFIDLAANIYICNNWFLMTEYYKKLTTIGKSIIDSSSPGKARIQFRLGLKDGNKGMILNLQNVYYLLTSSYNLVNLRLLNNNRIFYDNRNKTLYQLGNNKILAQARQ